MKKLNKSIVLIAVVFLFAGFSAADSNERWGSRIDLLPEFARTFNRSTESLEQLIAGFTALHAEFLDSLFEKHFVIAALSRMPDPPFPGQPFDGESSPAYSVVVDPDKPPEPPLSGQPSDGESSPAYSVVVDPDKPPEPPR